MGKIKCICFDIDGVLFDRDKAEFESLKEINDEFFHDDFLNFRITWKKVNKYLWDNCAASKYTQDEVVKLRWKSICKIYKFSNLSYQNLSHIYIKNYTNSKFKTALASYVKDYYYAGYMLGVITNGVKFVQYKKLFNLEILKYFINITTSTEAKFRKPNLGIFKYFINQVNLCANEIVYIGDSDNDDIIPASKCGFVTIKYINKKERHLESDKAIFSYPCDIWDYIQSIS